MGSVNDPLLDVLPRLQSDGVSCHTIAWEAGADLTTLQELAEQTGKNVAKIRVEYRAKEKREMLIGMIVEDKVLDLLEKSANISEAS